MTDPQTRWLDWISRLQSLAQNGLNYAQDRFDQERYRAARDIAAEMLAAATDRDIPSLRDFLSLDSGHATPKVDVRGVIFDEQGRVLLVHERSDGRWTLPGGWADPGESAAESTVREVREESGYEARAVKLLAVYDYAKHNRPRLLHTAYKLFFRCEIVGGSQGGDGLETTDVKFFAPDALPPLSEGRASAAQLARMFEHFRQSDLPTDFD